MQHYLDYAVVILQDTVLSVITYLEFSPLIFTVGFFFKFSLTKLLNLINYSYLFENKLQ